MQEEVNDSNPPNPDDPGYRHRRWSKHFDEIDRQIAQLSLMCGVKVLDPGVIERVLKNDATVCDKNKPETFAKLRALLMMHYSVRERAVVALGPDEAMKIVQETVERLRDRLGDRLGGPAAA